MRKRVALLLVNNLKQVIDSYANNDNVVGICDYL